MMQLKELVWKMSNYIRLNTDLNIQILLCPLRQLKAMLYSIKLTKSLYTQLPENTVLLTTS